MHSSIRLAAAAIAAVAAAGAHAQPQPATPAQSAAPAQPANPAQPAAPHAALVNAQGKPVGTVVLDQTPNGLLVSVVAQGLPPGEHAFHFHETGRCEPATGFKTAGGHFAPRGNAHGFEVEKGPHAGDMPNQFVTDDGRLRTQVFISDLALDQGPNALADADGAALVIHSGADDYRSQPSGAAGDRVACAVVAGPGQQSAATPQ